MIKIDWDLSMNMAQQREKATSGNNERNDYGKRIR